MKRIILALFAVLFAQMAWAATLLPNGRQQFLDGNGRPLVGGSVYFYVPGTTTTKSTWQDPAQSIVNTNPIILDGNGFATIYGSGSYRQVVKDAAGNTIWDTLTADTSANGPQWAGIGSGTVNAQSVTAGAFTAADGQSISYIPGYTNSGSMTLSVNGTVYNVYKDMTSGPAALSGGEVVAQNVVTVIYDQTLGGFHLVTPAQSISASNVQTTLAAGTVTDLGTAGTANIQINGTSTIGSFGNSASTVTPFYRLSFQNPLTITYNSISMQLPGNGDLKVGAGDTMTVQYLGAGDWKVVSLLRATDSGAIPGEVRSFAMASCPAGYLEANGNAISRTTYSSLYANLSTTWGTGDGSTTFNLPDFRGQFLRGWDHGAGVDAGRTFASNQGFAVQDHTHNISIQQSSGGGAGAASVVGPSNGGTTAITSGNMASGSSATETRPTNRTVVFCVKY